MPRGRPIARPPGAPRAPGAGRPPTGRRVELSPDAAHALLWLAEMGGYRTSPGELAAYVAELIENERQRVLAANGG